MFKIMLLNNNYLLFKKQTRRCFMEKMVSPCRFCDKKDREVCSKICELLKEYRKKIGNPLEFRRMGISYDEIYCLDNSIFRDLR